MFNIKLNSRFLDNKSHDLSRIQESLFSFIDKFMLFCHGLFIDYAAHILMKSENYIETNKRKQFAQKMLS
jgi:hypothetical protein